MHEVDHLNSLLYEKFALRKKIKISGDRGVLTAIDDNMFIGFQLLYYSLTLSHEVQFAVVDLGLNASYRGWCEKQNIQMLPIPENLVFPNKKEYYWQTWNKPSYIENSPFSQTLWLDSDVIVQGSLAFPFEVINNKPFIIEDSYPAVCSNMPQLYTHRKFYIPEYKRSNTYLNGGVLGFDLKRDKDLIDLWKKTISNAFDSPASRDAISWYDQGALLWTLEYAEKTDLIRQAEWTFNYPGGNPLTLMKQPDLKSFLTKLPYKDSAIIRHFAGPFKPWQDWKEKEFFLKDPIDLKMLVLAHEDFRLDVLPRRPYLELINLNRLNGEFQKNEFAESRIYLDPDLMSKFGNHEYVGLGSAQWNYKYNYNRIPKIQDLHKFRDLLAPDVILVPAITFLEPSWDRVTCSWNLGMYDYIKELASFTNMPIDKGPSFWANNYICHRNVMKEYLIHFKKIFSHFTEKYSNKFDFAALDPKRTPAFFYEAVTVHYFSNRTDLKIIQLTDQSG